MTTVPQQALFSLNSTFMLARADALARQVAEVEAPQRISLLYRRVLGRDPSPLEREQCEHFVESSSWEQLAQVLLMTNELIFVD
jgi:hypothetical protein